MNLNILNHKIIDDYDKNVRSHSDRTKYNDDTRYSIHGLVNRRGYTIKPNFFLN